MKEVKTLNEVKAGEKRKAYELKKDQAKYFVDLSKERKDLELLHKKLVEANEKDFGRDLTFKDLALYGIKKITSKDIDRLRENSLSEMEKVHKALNDYNIKSGEKLSLGEFQLIRGLK